MAFHSSSMLWTHSALAQMVNNLPANAETQVQETQAMAAHSCFLAWRIPRTEEPGAYSLQGRKESHMTE